MKQDSSISLFWDSIATGLYSGRFPRAPGTAGTFAAFLIAWGLLSSVPGVFLTRSWGLVILVLIAVGIKAADEVVNRGLYGSGEKDPQQIVIDEFAGYAVTLFAVPATLTTLIIGFLLFRVFDITKPPPIRKLEAFPKGLGIMMDDVMAGIYANLVLRFILSLM